MGERVVIVAVDASQHSKAAFEWYLENIFRPTDVVVITHCPEIPNLPSFTFKSGINLPVEDWQKAIQQQLEKVKRLEEDYEGTLIGKKIKYKVKGEAHSSPGEGIIKVAEDEKASLIVVGSRGLDAVRRTILGSVSDYVLHHASIPVVVCPARR